jgi:hypothetical protein
MEIAVIEFAKEFGITPWQAYEECTAEWWEWWKLYRSELGKFEKSQLKGK